MNHLNLFYLITILSLLGIIIIFYYELPRMHFISSAAEGERLNLKKLEQLSKVYFNLNTHNDQEISLASLQGKLSIIHLWSPSSVSCRDSITYLNRVYEQYHNHGLEILSVSIDRDIDLWKEALVEEKMPWLQAIDSYTNKSKYSDQMMEWGVSSIPFLLIIDKTGRILLINPNELETDRALSQIFAY